MFHVALASALLTATPTSPDAASIQACLFATDGAVHGERKAAQRMRAGSKGGPVKLLRSAIIVMRRRRSQQFTRRAATPPGYSVHYS